jgi:hypothetical protein
MKKCIVWKDNWGDLLERGVLIYINLNSEGSMRSRQQELGTGICLQEKKSKKIAARIEALNLCK